MDKSTPRPWHIEAASSSVGGWLIADDANGWTLCQRSDWPARAEMSDANAALIVKAVNRDAAFDALVEALRNMLVMAQCGDEDEAGLAQIEAARAALALAKET